MALDNIIDVRNLVSYDEESLSTILNTFRDYIISLETKVEGLESRVEELEGKD